MTKQFVPVNSGLVFDCWLDPETGNMHSITKFSLPYCGNQEQDSVTYDDDEADLYENSNADEDTTMGSPTGEREV